VSITFTCLCGKRLKARESSAGKRTQCPQCGEPVGIPESSAPVAPPSSRKEAADAATTAARVAQAQPIPASILAPSASAEIEKLGDLEERAPRKSPPAAQDQSAGNNRVARSTEAAGAQPKPYFMVDDDQPPPQIRKKRRDKNGRPQTRGLPAGLHPGSVVEAASQSLAESPEQGLTLRKPPKWYRLISRNGDYRGPALLHELGSLLGNLPLVVSISFLLTLTFCASVTHLSEAMQQSGSSPAFVIATAIAFLVIAAHVCSFLHQSLQIAVYDRGAAISLDPVRTVKASFAWIIAVLAGPIIPAAGTFFYWLQIGLDESVDWVILAELIWLTFFWLTASLVSYGVDPVLKSVLPHRAFPRARLIPWAIGIRSALGAALCAATIAGIWFGLVQIHVEPFYGFVVVGGTFLVSISLGATLAASLGRAGARVIPRTEVEPDAKTKEFERELASQR
jgi:hypothetical protein